MCYMYPGGFQNVLVDAGVWQPSLPRLPILQHRQEKLPLHIHVLQLMYQSPELELTSPAARHRARRMTMRSDAFEKLLSIIMGHKLQMASQPLMVPHSDGSMTKPPSAHTKQAPLPVCHCLPPLGGQERLAILV